MTKKPTKPTKPRGDDRFTWGKDTPVVIIKKAPPVDKDKK